MADTNILLESGTNELNLLEFVIADRHFGINVSKVSEIMRYPEIIPMPRSNPFVEGIFKPRDDIITLINLPGYMGLPESPDVTKDVCIVTYFNKVQMAFHVHNVETTHKISWEMIEKPDAMIYGGDEGLATGIARLDDRLIMIIDFEKILAEINPTVSIQLDDIDKLGERQRSDIPLMIAEDSVLLERLICDCLGKAGYTNVTVCTNGAEAWDKLQHVKRSGHDLKDHCALLVTDLEMPKMDGHRLLKLIRDDEFTHDLPVIIFSSLISEEMRFKGKSLGASEQLSKPEISELVMAIDSLIM